MWFQYNLKVGKYSQNVMIKKIVLKEMGLLSKKENPKSLPVKGSDVCDFFFALFAQRGGTKNKRSTN